MTNTQKTIKKLTGVRLDPDLLKQLKYLALDQDRTVTSLLEEAARDLLKKYGSQK